MVVKINHFDLGTVKVRIDDEDSDIFHDYPIYVKRDFNTNTDRVAVQNSTKLGCETYVSRMILEKHDMLSQHKNVKHKNGNTFDLRKSNLIQKS